MVLNLHRSKQWMYCHVKDTILEHARGHYYEVTLYRMSHLFHSHYKSPNDLAVSAPSQTVHSGPSSLTVCVGLTAEYVSHYHESDLLGPPREGKKTLEDLVCRVPASVTPQQLELPHQQHNTAGSVLLSCHTAESSLVKVEHCSPEIATPVILRALPRLASVSKAPDLPQFSSSSKPGPCSDNIHWIQTQQWPSACICPTTSCIILGWHHDRTPCCF